MVTAVKRTKKVERGLTDERLAREMQWRTWFPDDLVFDSSDELPDDQVDRLVAAFQKFCREAIFIKVPGKRVPFELREAQLDTVRSWFKYRYTVTLKARQIGFSTLSAAFCLWVAVGGGDRQIYMLSKKQETSVSLLNKAKIAWKSMPQWVRERSPALLDKTQLKMTFDNDSFIVSGPTASDPIRGETAFLVICDEWASFPDQEAAWASVEPATDIGGRIIGLSTAKGEGDFFHRLWVGAQTESNTFHPVFHPWWAVPERDEGWYEDKRKNLEPWQLFQEYPSNPEEAFIGSGNPFFNLELLRDMHLSEPLKKVSIECTETGNRWTEDEGGDFWVYEEPSRDKSYVVGADIAQGLDHGDWSVAFVLDSSNGNIVGVYRGKPDPDYFANIIAGIGYKYNYALAAPEVNNHGRTTVDHLRRRGYSRIYRRRTQMKRQQSPTETIGWLTTHGNKAELLDNLSVWLREHNVPHRSTLEELKTFRREQRGERIRLQGSPHDDCVMALAISVEARKFALESNIGRIKEDMVPGSIAWWARQLDRDKRSRRTKIRPTF